MGKISNTIQMLNYLNTGNKYTVKELSEKIGITERMVRYYKVELEQAGIPIETFMGPNGGYYILNTKNQYNHFNKYDLQLLENINMVLEKIGYEDIVKYKKLILLNSPLKKPKSYIRAPILMQEAPNLYKKAINLFFILIYPISIIH